MVSSVDSSTFAWFALGFSALVLIVLLPLLVESKRQKVATTAIAVDNASVVGSELTIASLEGKVEKFELDQAIVRRMSEIIAVLPDLEA